MIKKYYCRTCHGIRNHEIIFEKKVKGSDEFDFIQWNENYSVIECQGCETLSFLYIYGDSEMVQYGDQGEPEYFDKITLYPSSLENGKEIEQLFYLPDKIRYIYAETLSAFKANAYILTAAGFRAIIEALCNHLKIRKNELTRRIDLLHDKGFLSLNESKRLHSIRFMGNDALHEVETPKREQLLILLEIINHLLENLFIQDKKIGNRIDTIVDNYEDFMKLLRNKLSNECLNKEMTLHEILGKSRRLIKDTEFKNFEDKLQEAIETKKIDFLIIIKDEEKIVYRLEKSPAFSFDF